MGLIDPDMHMYILYFIALASVFPLLLALLVVHVILANRLRKNNIELARRLGVDSSYFGITSYKISLFFMNPSNSLRGNTWLVKSFFLLNWLYLISLAGVCFLFIGVFFGII